MGAEAALPIVGGAVQAAGAAQAANAKSAAYNYNANIALQNADLTLQQTDEEVRRQNVYATQFIGAQRANYGSSGVSSASGSALDVLQESARNAALDALTIKHAGDMKAWAYQSGAALDKMGATEAQIAGTYGELNAALGAASGAMRAGAFDGKTGGAGGGGGSRIGTWIGQYDFDPSASNKFSSIG